MLNEKKTEKGGDILKEKEEWTSDELPSTTEVPDEITENLYPEEKVSLCIQRRRRLEAKPKYLAVTDRRAIYLDQKILGRYDLKDLPYEKMEYVRFHQGVIGSDFELKNEDGSLIKVDWLHKEGCKEAIEAIRDALNAIAVEPVSISKKKMLAGREEWTIMKPKEVVSKRRVVEKPEAPTKEDPMEKLKKLKELYDEGVINQEEYEEKKNELMELI